MGNPTPNLTIFLLLLLLLCPLLQSQAQTTDNTTGAYTCSAQTLHPCQSYVFFRAQAPDYLNLTAISDLFGVSSLMITKATNLSYEPLSLNSSQNLLIPITCACMGTYSQANITYEIKGGNTFYLVSTSMFQNLTTYQEVEVANPTLVPTNLTIGVEVVFPIRCQCPSKTQLQNLINFLITYVVQPSDSLDSISALLGSTIQNLRSANNGSSRLIPYSTLVVPVPRLPSLVQLPVNVSTSPPPPPPPLPTPPASSSGNSGTVKTLDVLVGVLGFLVFVSLILITGLCVSRSREKRRAKKVTVPPFKKRESLKQYGGSASDERSFMADVSDCLDKYRLYSITDLREATNNFDPMFVIHGSVYRGTIGGEVYAIKKMKWNAYEELKILQKVNHTNLVKLQGFCIDIEDGNCYLVYEYLENGSLHSWLHHYEGPPRSLDWKARLQIAMDVANGLQYIHEHTTPSVVHKDIKSSNVLLDAKLRAKIANFGLAKSGCNAITMHIVGTQGYMAPEYLADGLVTTKMDVFAFGVVLLELVSGREAIGEDGRFLWLEVNWVMEGGERDGVEREKRLREWADSVLMEENSCGLESVMSVMGIARACLHKEASKRPNMVDVLFMLSKADGLCFEFDCSVDRSPSFGGGLTAR